MAAGTITLTNGSDAVTGTGTAFTTDLVAGDFVVATVGGITYTLPVKAVDSDTALTLISKYAGPTQANLAWNVVPRATQNQVTAELVAQVTQALRGQNYDKANWQAVFSARGDITVLLPDGSTFTGPSWNKISELLADIDPVALQALADQVNTDAQQVATDRQSVELSAQQVELDKLAAVQAADTASNANASAQLAKQGAEQSALEAHNDKEAIGDLQAAVDAVNSVATLPLGFTFWWASRATIPNGAAAYDGQELDRATYPSLFSAIQTGKLPVVTEAVWQADPSKRHCFTLGATAGKFRVPDMNGAQTGSISQLALTGGAAAQEGIQNGEIPNLTGEFSYGNTLGLSVTSGVATGPFKKGATYPIALAGGATAAGSTQGIGFDAHQVSQVYSNTASDVHAARANGVICGQLFGRVTNPGDVDGATLATRIEAIYNELLAKVASTNARLGYALVDGGTIAANQRLVFTNPFGINTPVVVFPELQLNSKWFDPGWGLYDTSTLNAAGVRAGYVAGEGIIAQAGGARVFNQPSTTGALGPFGSSVSTATPLRLHVFKVTA